MHNAHHKSIIVELNIPLPAIILNHQIFNFLYKVNYKVVNDALKNSDWSSVANAQDVNTAEIIYALIHDLVPKKVTRSNMVFGGFN